METQTVDLVLFMDRSEVMENFQEDIANGLNLFVQEQKRIYRHLDATFTFVLANHSGWVVFDRIPLRDFPLLTDYDIPISHGSNLPAVVYDTMQRFSTYGNVEVFMVTGSTGVDQIKPALITFIKNQLSKSWSFFLIGIGKDAFELNEKVFELPTRSVVSIPKTTDGFMSLPGILTSFSNAYFHRVNHYG